jgi:archaeal flagellin FlaB
MEVRENRGELFVTSGHVNSLVFSMYGLGGKFMKEKKGEMGVGVLIVFIAMLLVAAIAAGVLITTITSLQQKALSTGAETKGEISTHVSFVEVTGTDGSNGDIENFSAILKLSSGSDAIALADTLLALGLSNVTNNYRYSATLNPSGSLFNATYEVQGSSYQQGFISRGDIVSIVLIPSRVVQEDELVRVTVIPKIGTQSVVEFRSPTVISRQLLTVFP